MKVTKRTLCVVVLLFAFLLCSVLFVNSANFNTAKAEEESKFTIVVSDEIGKPGETVNVKLTLKNNPGIASVGIDVAYGEHLKLTSVAFNSDMGGQTSTSNYAEDGSPVTLIWVNAFKEYSENTIFATLTFSILESANLYTQDLITITGSKEDIYNLEEKNIELSVVNGSVLFSDVVAGDINGDGKVNNKDITRLFQYLAKWKVEVNKLALDVNGDGKVNNKDITRLFQFLANWDVKMYVTNPSMITFDGNGATSGEMQNIYTKVGETVTLPQNTYNRDGYTFAGWNVSNNSEKIPTDAKEYNGHYYYCYDLSMSWSDAKAYCESLGGHLVTVTSDEENTWISNNFNSVYCWFGGYKENSAWNWITNETFSYTNWASGQPNNYNNQEDKLGTQINNDEWHDFQCSSNEIVRFICEWEPTIYEDGATFTVGTDSEYTLYAVWEKVTYDIIYDANGGELLFGNIPEDAKEHNGHYYYCYELSKSWTDAKAYCESLGGHLATVTSEEENTWLKNNFNVVRCWFGATDKETEGVWKWVTGEEWNYSDWYFGQPDNSNGCEDYIGYLSNSGYCYWNDFEDSSNGISRFICEWETNIVSKYTIESDDIELPTPTKVGYTFVGWNDGENTITVLEKGSFGNKDLIAVWEANTNVIHFVGNNATSGEMLDVEIKTDETIILPTNTYDKQYYKFVGWSTLNNSESIPADAKEYNGHYYYCFELTKSWTDAKAYCESLGGHLATVTSTEENTWITNNFNAINCWLGASDEETEGIWKWITGEEWNYTCWRYDQPDNYNGYEDYLGYFVGNGYWNDWGNSTGEVYRFICEWEPTIYEDGATFTAGTNSEYTLYAIWEIDATIIYFDGNGATSGEMDYVCVEKDTTITLSTNTYERDGYTFAGWVTKDGISILSDVKEYNGHYYYCFELTKSWKEAKAYCESLGGHLVTVTSAEENTWIANNFNATYGWIGATDEETEGIWKWVTGETWNYSNWTTSTSEPNNSDGIEHFACYWQTNGYWNDLKNDSYEQDCFFCEWDSGFGTIDYTDGDIFVADTTPETTLYAVWIKAYTRVNASNVEDEDGDYILFGSYPQTDVTSEMGTTLASYVDVLPTNGNNNGWTSYEYYIIGSNSTDFMWYKDVDVDSNGTNDYRAVYFTSYNTTPTACFQKTNGYYVNSVYWFKYEPIKWEIITEEDGYATLLAVMNVDTIYFDLSSNKYENSQVHTYINNEFYNVAFSRAEKSTIKQTELDSNGTILNDNVWLLTLSEASLSKNRQKYDTSYSKCLGLLSWSYGFCGWWTRTTSYAGEVWHIGYCADNYSSGIEQSVGLAPAIQIKLG